MTIVPGPWEDEISRAAERCARGDLRTAMAMLLGAYTNLVSRCVTSEHASDEWLPAAAGFHQAAANQLLECARFFVRGARSDSDEERALYMGTLHDAQDQAAMFAGHLRATYEALGLMREPDPDDACA